MEKVRVLEIGLSYKKGGIENFLINIGENINLSNVRIDFINTFESAKTEEFYKEIEKIGKIHNIPDYRKHPIKFYKAMKRLNNINNYDILHYHMNSAVYLLPLIVGKICGIKTIISHSHNSSSDKGIIKNIIHNINKFFIPIFANVFFACSDYAGQWFFSNKIRKEKKYFIINNAIEIEKYKYVETTRKKMRNDLEIKEDTIVIGNVGRFKPQKNHEFIVKVFEKYHKKNNNSKLLLIGTGPLVEKIKELVKSLGIENDVLFLGERNDAHNLYQAMDIFLLPSLYEGLPLVGVEAQVSGLKCFFSDSITKEVQISEDASFIALDKGADYWSKQLCPNFKNRTTKTADMFDINKNAARLEQIYISLKEKIGD